MKLGVTTEQYDKSRRKLNIVDSLDKRIENADVMEKFLAERFGGEIK